VSEGLMLSTSWKSSKVSTVEELVKGLENLSISGIELEYRVRESILKGLRKELRSMGIPVISIHNFFPLPDDVPISKASGDLFLLSHTDKEERLQAVKWTIRTLEHADNLEARFVVIHGGKIDMDPEIDIIFEWYKNNILNSEKAQEFIKGKLKEREKKKGKHLDALLWSLERLVKTAEKYNIYLGLENRAYYHELPGPQEFSTIFAEFEGAPLGYWHDTGHAHINTVIGFSEHKTLLKTYRTQLIGIHLHDAKGVEDHLPPGSGEISFSEITAELAEGTPKVIELKPGTPDNEVARSLSYLAKLQRD